jgi:hypothetical protein
MVTLTKRLLMYVQYTWEILKIKQDSKLSLASIKNIAFIREIMTVSALFLATWKNHCQD